MGFETFYMKLLEIPDCFGNLWAEFLQFKQGFSWVAMGLQEIPNDLLVGGLVTMETAQRTPSAILHLYPLPKTHEQMAKNMKAMVILLIIFGNTVDGRYPASVEVGSLSHCLQGVIHPRWLFGISEPSAVQMFQWIYQIPKLDK